MPKATTVQQAMNQLLAGTDCVVTFSNGHIIIKKQASNTTNQQSKLVKGTIVDATGMPVIGANVMVKGTTNGTITDMDVPMEPLLIWTVISRWKSLWEQLWWFLI